ncbi:putative rRNA methyltransferase [Capsicum baccatum]|uniref:rRNA methyltransferase n=1 Tax=Capsicum baccatum TaxID=33114 RepID=A0A2G2WYA9_CAPBA|nr:putative rRNA methyltransferase [Capsicum baccatum]
MGKVKGKHRLDKYYHLAKEQGYRSRAAWKLIQLDSKYNFLHSSQSVLDLCAAPGGWMQVAVKHVPVGSLVIGVDLDPIRPIRGAISVQHDITTPKCRSIIKKLMAENGCRAFDLVLHDGSPNVGGAWAKEATSQNSLVIDSVKLATELLAPKGTFITKIFRSQDYNAVLYCLRQLFEKVEVDKPLASRSASAEIYIIGFKYKAPAKIDPRLLDVKHLFQGGKEPPKVIDVLGVTKQKRHRDGYEDGATVLRKVCSVANFVWSENPVQVLGSFTSMSFDDPACLAIRDHALTTEEVYYMWSNIRKALSPEKIKTSTTVVESESKEVEVEDEDEDERVLNEIEEKTNVLEKKQKKEKRLQAKRRAKEKARKALGIQVDATEDGYVDEDLFSLSSIKWCDTLSIFEKIDLLNLQKIKSISIKVTKNERVKIRAPTLEHLSYSDSSYYLSGNLDVIECQNLKSLELKHGIRASTNLVENQRASAAGGRLLLIYAARLANDCV